jgi:hypothetical protein
MDWQRRGRVMSLQRRGRHNSHRPKSQCLNGNEDIACRPSGPPSGSGRSGGDDGGDAETFVFATGTSRWPLHRRAATRGAGATGSTCLRIEVLVLAWLRLASPVNVSCTRDGRANAGHALSMTISLAQGSKQSVKSEHAGGCSTAVGVIGSKNDTSKLLIMRSARPLPPLPKSSVATATGAQKPCAKATEAHGPCG